MAHRSVHLVSSVLEGIPLALCRVDPSKESAPFYRYDVELAVDDPATLRGRALWGSRVTLVFTAGGIEAPVHGMIADLSQDPPATRDRIRLRFAVVPRVWLLSRTGARETFLDLPVREIMARKLRTAGFKENEDFILDFQAVRPPHEQVVQNGCTDLDFLGALCRLAGLSSSFEHGHGRDVLVISAAEGRPAHGSGSSVLDRMSSRA